MGFEVVWPRRPWRPQKELGEYFQRLHFWNQWVPLIKTQCRVRYLLNFDLKLRSGQGCFSWKDQTDRREMPILVHGVLPRSSSSAKGIKIQLVLMPPLPGKCPTLTHNGMKLKFLLNMYSFFSFNCFHVTVVYHNEFWSITYFLKTHIKNMNCSFQRILPHYVDADESRKEWMN